MGLVLEAGHRQQRRVPEPRWLSSGSASPHLGVSLPCPSGSRAGRGLQVSRAHERWVRDGCVVLLGSRGAGAVGC